MNNTKMIAILITLSTALGISAHLCNDRYGNEANCVGGSVDNTTGNTTHTWGSGGEAKHSVGSDNYHYEISRHKDENNRNQNARSHHKAAESRNFQ